MNRDILPAQLEVERDEHSVVKSAVLRIGGQFAYPYKWVQWDVELDNVAHLTPRPWVPCSEGLPEEGEDVLAWIERDAWVEDNDYPIREQEHCIGWQINGRWHFDGLSSSAKCLAWMPLPEPPKEATHD